MSKRDYYDVLGIAKGASPTRSKRAIARKAKELHPTATRTIPKPKSSSKRPTKPRSSERPEKKAAYDRYGHAALRAAWVAARPAALAAGQGDFSSLFRRLSTTCLATSWVASGGGGGDRAARGSDLRFNLRFRSKRLSRLQKTINVPTAVAVTAAKAQAQKAAQSHNLPDLFRHGQSPRAAGFFTVERTCPTCSGMGQIIKNPCKACSGQGRVEKETAPVVNIPAGVETGTRIRLAGEGEAGMRGGPSGDLYIFIEVEQHELFERDGTPVLPCACVDGCSAAWWQI